MEIEEILEENLRRTVHRQRHGVSNLNAWIVRIDMPANFTAGIPANVTSARVQLWTKCVVVIHKRDRSAAAALLRTRNVREVVIALTINHALERAAQAEIKCTDQIAAAAVRGVHAVHPVIHLARRTNKFADREH